MHKTHANMISTVPAQQECNGKLGLLRGGDSTGPAQPGICKQKLSLQQVQHLFGTGFLAAWVFGTFGTKTAWGVFEHSGVSAPHSPRHTPLFCRQSSVCASCCTSLCTSAKAVLAIIHGCRACLSGRVAGLPVPGEQHHRARGIATATPAASAQPPACSGRPCRPLGIASGRRRCRASTPVPVRHLLHDLPCSPSGPSAAAPSHAPS